uniref:Uncharacterized protein n=1 Tax=Hyaloperonospora arabidopsidis (strain Emoy2) TaxID=559515 RepID=M4BXW1_HYAAE
MQQRPSNRHQRKRGIALVGADTGIEDRRILILVGIDPEVSRRLQKTQEDALEKHSPTLNQRSGVNSGRRNAAKEVGDSDGDARAGGSCNGKTLVDADPENWDKEVTDDDPVTRFGDLDGDPDGNAEITENCNGETFSNTNLDIFDKLPATEVGNPDEDMELLECCKSEAFADSKSDTRDEAEVGG